MQSENEYKFAVKARTPEEALRRLASTIYVVAEEVLGNEDLTDNGEDGLQDFARDILGTLHCHAEQFGDWGE